MSSARPNSETARRMGMVPYNGTDGSNNGAVNNGAVNNGSMTTSKPNNFSSSNTKSGGGYPTVNGSFNKAGNPAPENGKTSSYRGNDQLWSNGSGVNQGSAPTWPTNEQGVPVNPGNGWQSKQTAAQGPGGGGSAARGYIQAPQSVDGRPGAQQQYQQQQQQQPNFQQQPGFQGKSGVSEGIPVNAGNNWQSNRSGGYVQGAQPVNGSQAGGYVQGAQPVNGSQAEGYVPGIQPTNGPQQPNFQVPNGGQMTEGPTKGPMPKGDYVYYDGNGNQVASNGGPRPNDAGSGSEKHFHHHYYHNSVNNQPAPQQAGYPYDKNMEKQRKRKPGASALAAALIACWACTCCCHAPCGC